MKPTGMLKNWQIHKTANDGRFATGYLYGDTKGRFVDGQLIRTSLLREIVPGGGESWHLVTLNSVYVVDNHDRVDRSDPIVRGQKFIRSS